MREIVSITIGLVLMGVLFPIGLGLISAAGDVAVDINGTSTLVSAVADQNVLTLLTTIVPIVAVIGIVLGFMPRFS